MKLKQFKSGLHFIPKKYVYNAFVHQVVFHIMNELSPKGPGNRESGRHEIDARRKALGPSHKLSMAGIKKS